MVQSASRARSQDTLPDGLVSAPNTLTLGGNETVRECVAVCLAETVREWVFEKYCSNSN
jgi:hypothetical protein